MWLKYIKGGNSKRQLDVSCILPEPLFHKYIFQFNGKQYGQSFLIFKGGSSRLSTKYSGGKCPYRFVTWFFNNAKSMKCVSRRRPEEWINMYNYNFSYNKQNNKLRFTCDITWKFIATFADHPDSQPVWQKLNDTT